MVFTPYDNEQHDKKDKNMPSGDFDSEEEIEEESILSMGIA